MDKDLEFLKKCSNEQLQMLADRIAYNDKGQTRYNETLTNRSHFGANNEYVVLINKTN